MGKSIWVVPDPGHIKPGTKNLTQGFTLVVVMSCSLTTMVAERALTLEPTVQ